MRNGFARIKKCNTTKNHSDAMELRMKQSNKNVPCFLGAITSFLVAFLSMILRLVLRVFLEISRTYNFMDFSFFWGNGKDIGCIVLAKGLLGCRVG